MAARTNLKHLTEGFRWVKEYGRGEGGITRDYYQACKCMSKTLLS
jgi:hypothetical protein